MLGVEPPWVSPPYYPNVPPYSPALPPAPMPNDLGEGAVKLLKKASGLGVVAVAGLVVVGIIGIVALGQGTSKEQD